MLKRHNVINYPKNARHKRTSKIESYTPENQEQCLLHPYPSLLQHQIEKPIKNQPEYIQDPRLFPFLWSLYFLLEILSCHFVLYYLWDLDILFELHRILICSQLLLLCCSPLYSLETPGGPLTSQHTAQYEFWAQRTNWFQTGVVMNTSRLQDFLQLMVRTAVLKF